MQPPTDGHHLQEQPDPRQIIELARTMIDAAPKQGPLAEQVAHGAGDGAKRKVTYADALPAAAAPLAELLRTQEMVELTARYRTADARAVRAQTWNIWLTQAGALAGFGAGVLGALYLLDVSLSPFSLGLGALPVGLLGVAFASLLASILLRPLRTWKRQRLEAEELRLAVFERIVQSSRNSGDALAMALGLECFRRHLFEDQTAYFKRRSKDKRREARLWKALGWLAGLLTAVGSCVPQAVIFIGLLDHGGWLFQHLRPLADLLPASRKLYSLFWFSGVNLAALAALIPMIYKCSDLAKTYRREFRFLRRCARHLPAARLAAASGQWAAMCAFPQTVLAMLLEGVEEWASRDEMPDLAEPTATAA